MWLKKGTRFPRNGNPRSSPSRYGMSTPNSASRIERCAMQAVRTSSSRKWRDSDMRRSWTRPNGKDDPEQHPSDAPGSERKLAGTLIEAQVRSAQQAVLVVHELRSTSVPGVDYAGTRTEAGPSNCGSSRPVVAPSAEVKASPTAAPRGDSCRAESVYRGASTRNPVTGCSSA